MLTSIKRFCWLLLLVFLSFVLGCTGRKQPQVRELTPSQQRGERLYRNTCAVCHRVDSTQPLNGPGLQGLYQRKFLPSGAPTNDERVMEVLKQGRRNMPGYNQLFDDRQLNDIIAYLRTL